MQRSYAEGHLGTRKPIREDPVPQSRADTSTASFVGSLVLTSLVISAATALLLFAPLTITFPILIVLVAYLVGTLALQVYDRRRLFGSRRTRDAHRLNGE